MCLGAVHTPAPLPAAAEVAAGPPVPGFLLYLGGSGGCSVTCRLGDQASHIGGLPLGSLSQPGPWQTLHAPGPLSHRVEQSPIASPPPPPPPGEGYTVTQATRAGGHGAARPLAAALGEPRSRKQLARSTDARRPEVPSHPRPSPTPRLGVWEKKSWRIQMLSCRTSEAPQSSGSICRINKETKASLVPDSCRCPLPGATARQSSSPA